MYTSSPEVSRCVHGGRSGPDRSDLGRMRTPAGCLSPPKTVAQLSAPGSCRVFSGGQQPCWTLIWRDRSLIWRGLGSKQRGRAVNGASPWGQDAVGSQARSGELDTLCGGRGWGSPAHWCGASLNTIKRLCSMDGGDGLDGLDGCFLGQLGFGRREVSNSLRATGYA